MRDNIEKSLKRWLKNKIKITMALVTVFLITGSIGYAEINENIIDGNTTIEVEEFLDGIGLNTSIANKGKNYTDDFGEKNVSIQGIGIVVNQNKSKDEYSLNLSTTGNITIDKEKGVASSKYGGITISGGLNNYFKGEINSNKLVINNKTGKKSNVGIDINSDNIMTVGGGYTATLNITTIKDDVVLNDFGTGIAVSSGSILNLNSGKDIIINAGESDQYMGISQKSLGGSPGKNEINILAKNDIKIIDYKTGIYQNNSNKFGEITSENNISIIKNNTKGEIGIYLDYSMSSSSDINKNKLILNAGNEISIENYETGVATDNGEVNINAQKGIYIENVNTGISAEGNNNKITLSNLNKNIENINKINAAIKGINVEKNGEILLLGTDNQIFSDNIGINNNNGTVTIGETNDEILKKNTIISSGNEAIKTENNGTVNINALNIYISGNEAKENQTSIFTMDKVGNDESLQIYATVFGNTKGVINLTGDNIVIESKNTSHGDISSNEIKEEYAGVLSRGGSQINIDGNSEVISPDGVALYATNLNGGITNNKSMIELSDKGNHKIFGDIIAGKNSTIDIKGSGNNIKKYSTANEEIEILSANGGMVNLNLADGTFIGRIDDYYQVDDNENNLDDSVFRNNKFYLDITESGKINLTMNENSSWTTKGQSFITNINYNEFDTKAINENFGMIDLSTEAGTSVNIKNLGSGGTFKVKLNSEIAQGSNVDSDMIYVKNITSENTTINIIAEDAITLNDGEKLRFATIGEKTDNNFNDKVTFKINDVKEKGINNVSFKVAKEKYDINKREENSLYNGDNTEIGKPGNDFINTEYENGENWYLTRGKEEINDGGKTIIEMSKANYAGAVYMDNLNKRLGDMTFADGKEGFWVRLRNDRVGEDSEYRLHNYMTQLGYDKPYPMEEGKGTEYRGIAFEISKGDMDYKNINGDANIDRQALWLYDTNVYNNGFYSDYVFRVGRMESEFDIYGRETGAKVEGTYKNLFLGASAEYGYRMNLSEKSYFEPQVQLQYTYIDGTDYTTNQDTKVELDEIHSVIGRAGFRLGHDFYNEEGRKTTTIYAKADVNYEFLGEQKVEAKDLTGSLDKKYENDGTWYDIGIGVSKDITPDFNVYMDVERQIGRTRDDQSWQVNLGFRYVLGE